MERSKRRTETGCMGPGYLGQNHRPSSGLIHALHQGVGAPRCVCVSHVRHRGGGAWLPNNAVGGGGTVDREEVNEGERVKKEKEKKKAGGGEHLSRKFSAGRRPPGP